MANMDDSEYVDEPKSISWRAAPFLRNERTIVWYATLAAVTLVLIGISIWQKNPFFGVFIAFAAILVGVLNRRRPEPAEFSVGESGVRIGKNQYPFAEFTEFTYRVRPGHLDQVILRRHSITGSHFHMPVDSKLGANVRAYLSERLPETDHKESFIDLFSDLLGF